MRLILFIDGAVLMMGGIAGIGKYEKKKNIQ